MSPICLLKSRGRSVNGTGQSFTATVGPSRVVRGRRANKRRTAKIRPKAVGGGIFGRFSNFDQCRPEVADDVISSVAVD